MLSLLIALAAAQDLPAQDLAAQDLPASTSPGDLPEELPATVPLEPAPGLPPGQCLVPARQPATEPAPEAVAALETYLFPPLDDETRQGVRTDGVVVLHHGQVIYERYARGYDADSPHLTWSVSKTFTGALAGIAEQQGLLSVDDSVCEHLDDVDPEHCDITVEHVLSFSTGLAWRETYEDQPPTASSVVAMLYGSGASDMAGFTLHHPARDEPGASYQYSSGDANLLAAIAGGALAKEHGPRYAWTQLFDPLGISSATWERDDAGTLVGSSYLYMTPLDMARFGQFMLQDGCHDGQQLLPPDWMARSTAVPPGHGGPTYDRAPGDIQGWQVWLNQPLPGTQTPPRPAVPADAYAALGHWKQSIWVLPSQDMVVVRTGDDRDGSFDYNSFLPLAMALAGEQHAPAEQREEAPAPTAAAQGPDRYDTGLIDIATNYAARNACSCAYVMERDDAFCRAWIQVDPDIAKVRFDRDAGSVKARSLLLWSQEAAYMGPEQGCRLVD